MIESHPDIAFITSIVSYFAKNRSRQYTKAVTTVMQYLKATCTLGIIYKGDGEDLIIKGYSDSD